MTKNVIRLLDLLGSPRGGMSVTLGEKPRNSSTRRNVASKALRWSKRSLFSEVGTKKEKKHRPPRAEGGAKAILGIHVPFIRF